MKLSLHSSLEESDISSQDQYEENINKVQEDEDVYVIEEDATMQVQQQAQNSAPLQEEPQQILGKEVLYEKGELKPHQYRNAYHVREKMNRDTAKLGSKVRFKPTQEEKDRNDFIERSKAISKNATLYTADVADAVKEANLAMENKAERFAESTVRQQVDSYLDTIDKWHFTAKMFASAYIRKHLADCLNVVKSYEELKNLKKFGYRPDLGDYKNSTLMSEAQAKKIDDYEDIMALFSKRVKEYVKSNHVDMETGKGFDGKLENYEKINDEDYRQWLALVGDEKSKRKEERKRDALKDVTGEALDEVTREVLSSAQEEGDHAGFDISSVMQKSPAERIKCYGTLKAHIKTMEDYLKSGQLTDSPEDLAQAQSFRQSLMEGRLVLRVIEAEMEIAEFRLKEGNDAATDADTLIQKNPKLAEKYGQVREELRRYYKRNDHEDLEEGDERTAPAGLHKLTREEALSTYSDTKSFEARINLLRSAEALKKNRLAGAESVGRLVDAIGAYFDKNVYKSGEKAESNALLKVIRCAKDPQIAELAKNENYPELKALLDQIGNLTMGNLTVPEGAQIMDKGNGERPVSRGPRKFDHWFAKPLENFYRFFRKWESHDNDTPLFAHEPTVNDLRQGKISNCWMVSGTSAVINYDPNIIKDCMRDNGDGTVTVRLYKAGKDGPTPMYVRVTKEVPKLVTGGSIQTSGALWMQILEKAAAFIGYKSATEQDENAGYDALWHGGQRHWIYALTGRMWDSIIYMPMGNVIVEDAVLKGKVDGFSEQNLKGQSGNDQHLKNDQFKAELFNQLCHARENGKVFTYGSKYSDTPGMATGHAYTVVSAGQEGEERFVILRNPYANRNAQYRDDGSLYQTGWYFSSNMNNTCGMFKIKYEDFLKNCGELAVVDMKKDIKEKKKEQPEVKDPVVEDLLNMNGNDF